MSLSSIQGMYSWIYWNVLLNSLAQKYCLQYKTISNFQPPLSLNENLRTTSYMKKFQITNFSNISLFQNKILCILVLCNSVYFLCIFTFSYFFFWVHILCFLAWKYLFSFFCFGLFFFWSSLVSVCNFFTFLLLFFNFFVLLKIF